MARATTCVGNEEQKKTWAAIQAQFNFTNLEIAPVDDGDGAYVFEYVEDGVMRAGYIEVDGNVTWC